MSKSKDTIHLDQKECACIYEATKQFSDAAVDLSKSVVALEPKQIGIIYGAVCAFKKQGYSLKETELSTVNSVLSKLERLGAEMAPKRT